MTCMYCAESVRKEAEEATSTTGEEEEERLGTIDPLTRALRRRDYLCPIEEEDTCVLLRRRILVDYQCP